MITVGREIQLASGKIELLEHRLHAKASEGYIDVRFTYKTENPSIWCGSVPIEYRRTGVHAETDSDVDELLKAAFVAMRPSVKNNWLEEQKRFWATKPRAGTTKQFFDALITSEWTCQGCQFPQNPNWARRTQDIKEFGFTVATYPNRFCATCGEKKTHMVLVRLPRGGQTGYEVWTPKLRTRILKVLQNYDAFEGKKIARHLLPDHKFPEIRWDGETREENPDYMIDADIRKKFQLISNQRNQEKREVCRRCYQDGVRGTPFGINFFYEGDSAWPEGVPRRGRIAEQGCIGCGWYDLQAWRDALNKLHKP